MNNEERRRKGKELLINAYPDKKKLLDATSGIVLSALLDRKTELYSEPCPTVGELADIYDDQSIGADFAKRAVVYMFFLKENAMPTDGVIKVHSGNFFVVCKNKTINQVLCFLAEYPSMRQFGKGFDYSHFVGEFKDYCTEWYRQTNLRIEERLKREESERKTEEGHANGIDNLRHYVDGLIRRGIDPRRGGLYNCSEDTAIGKGVKRMIDLACEMQMFDEAATKEYAVACGMEEQEEDDKPF